MHLNEATLLNNVKIRYSKDKIYVSSFTNSKPNCHDNYKYYNIYYISINLFIDIYKPLNILCCEKISDLCC